MRSPNQNFAERYKLLNPEQQKAVDATEGPVLVVAGPGAGKTELLSIRVANILKNTDVTAGSILCLTFTEAAARNMRERLVGLIGVDAYRVAIHTFHGFAESVRNRYPEYFRSGATFQSVSELHRVEIVSDLLETLPLQNPLRTAHPSEGFIYLKDSLTQIGNFKKAGLTPVELQKILLHNKEFMEYLQPKLQEIFAQKISISLVDQLNELLQDLQLREEVHFPVTHLPSWKESFVRSLEGVIQEVQEIGKTPPLTAWRNRWIRKEQNQFILKDLHSQEKLETLAEVYEGYQQKLHEEGLYDFDDMILDLLLAIEQEESLRFSLQERYLYLLVDEFQDTNEAQMRLIYLLADNPVHEGRPNIMAVGDDDQAIYKFQGAEIANIHQFTQVFRDPVVITLTQNYRSTQAVLDLAREIIQQGEVRLENLLPEIEKSLVAANPKIEEGDISHVHFESVRHQYAWIASEIDACRQVGKECGDIAIIARKHADLEAIIPYLHERKIPINYERQLNIFLEPHIHQLLQIARFLSAMYLKKEQQADYLLPEILAYPFWDLNRMTIWQISRAADKEDKLWVEVMCEHESEQVNNIANFLITMAAEAHVQPLETTLDQLIGAHIELLPEDGEGELADEDFEEIETAIPQWASPFKQYYFSEESRKSDPATFLRFLSSLQIFVGSLQEYVQGKPATIVDMIRFADLHEQNNLPLANTSTFMGAESSVNLLTAHSAKGLEFESVFILNCLDSNWGKARGSGKLSLPVNMPFAPDPEIEDDFLRLFFVALTRVKRFLYLTSYQNSESGRSEIPLRFIADLPAQKQELSVPEAVQLLDQSWRTIHTPPFLDQEASLLRPLLEQYQMSVTHLNNFLDIINGGPQRFLEENLLRFPAPQAPEAAYGSAVHRVFARIYDTVRETGVQPELGDVLEWFTEALKQHRLLAAKESLYIEKGVEALSVFYSEKSELFESAHFSEYNFRHQHVHIGEAHIGGKIDKLIPTSPTTMCVYDFKTSKGYNSMNEVPSHKKAGYVGYERQLMFYKLLVENSRDFGGKYMVEKGVLEFVQPLNGSLQEMEFTFSEEKMERLKLLIEKVWQKIFALDFPDTSHYPATLKGVTQFEDDLLEGRI